MPLSGGTSRKAIGENIKRSLAEGKSREQSIAIALSKARSSGAKIPKPPKKEK